MQSKANPEVSVIMNCLNCEKYLREAIDSVYAQTYKDWEIIFWDNASTDNSAEIAKSYDERLRYFRSEETVLLSNARNWAVERAKGEYIAFLDCDDIFCPTKLKKQMELFKEKPWLGAIYADSYDIDSYGNIIRRMSQRSTPHDGRIFKQLFLEECFMKILTLMVKRKVLEDVGLFMPSLNITEDNDINFKIAYHYEVGYIPEPLAKYRHHAGPRASGDYLKATEEIYQVCHYWQRLAKERDLPEKDLINDVYFYRCKKNVYLSIFHKKNIKAASKYLFEAFRIYDSKFENIMKFFSQMHITSMAKLKKYHEGRYYSSH